MLPTVQMLLAQTDPAPAEGLALTGQSAAAAGAVLLAGRAPLERAFAERLRQESHQQLIWRRCLTRILPPDWLAAIRIWQEDDGRIVLGCPSGAMAAKLRQLAPRCMHCFRACSPQVSGFRVEVQGQGPATQALRHGPAKATLPVEAGLALQALAGRVRSPALAQALRQLAARAGPAAD